MKSPQLPRILVGASMSCRSIVPSRANDIMFFASTPFHSTIGMSASALHLCRASLEHRRPKSIQVDGWDDDLAYFSRKRQFRLMRDPHFGLLYDRPRILRFRLMHDPPCGCGLRQWSMSFGQTYCLFSSHRKDSILWTFSVGIHKDDIVELAETLLNDPISRHLYLISR